MSPQTCVYLMLTCPDDGSMDDERFLQRATAAANAFHCIPEPERTIVAAIVRVENEEYRLTHPHPTSEWFD